MRDVGTIVRSSLAVEYLWLSTGRAESATGHERALAPRRPPAAARRRRSPSFAAATAAVSDETTHCLSFTHAHTLTFRTLLPLTRRRPPHPILDKKGRVTVEERATETAAPYAALQVRDQASPCSPRRALSKVLRSRVRRRFFGIERRASQPLLAANAPTGNRLLSLPPSLSSSLSLSQSLTRPPRPPRSADPNPRYF
jgi:hypothetical protein